MSEPELPISIEPARAADEGEVSRLLGAVDLEADFDAREFTVARAGGRVVACAALRRLEGGLELASVAVDPSLRLRGVGAAVVRAALGQADGPVHALALAPGFFLKLGFERIDAVPAFLAEKASTTCSSKTFLPLVRP